MSIVLVFDQLEFEKKLCTRRYKKVYLIRPHFIPGWFYEMSIF